MLLRVALAASLFFSLPATILAETPTTTHAGPTASALKDPINEAGRLRMLSERMGKAYAQIPLSVMPEKAREQLAQSQKRFEDNLAFLSGAATTPELKNALSAVVTSYRAYSVALSAAPNKSSVAVAHRLTDKIVAEADRLTAAFSANANVPSAKIVNISGRQRMLSQRMARMYFATALTGEKNDIEKFRLEFKTAMTTLESAPLSSAEIKRELELAKVQWMFFEQALQGTGDMASNLKNIATTSERLLETMDNLTAMYSAALATVMN